MYVLIMNGNIQTINDTTDTGIQFYGLYKTWGIIKTNLTSRNHLGMSLMCQNTTMRVYGAWIKTYYVLCSKTYSGFGNVSQSSSSLRQAAGSARICETVGSMTWVSNDILHTNVGCNYLSLPSRYTFARG